MLFQVLNTPKEERPKNLDETLVDFPYVNGGLFSENLRIAAFTADMRHALIKAMRFGWGGISPAVFGSLFQSVKSKELRRELGEHYTTETAIMRVIGPLFLDDLKERLASAKGSPQKLRNFRKDLSSYNFLDPACGCGNFLIVSYREMRRLELAVLVQLRELKEDNQLSLDPTLGLQVTVEQFSGIELEEWPAKVAETAMFLVDHQMNLELAEEFGLTPDRLPIKKMLNVQVANALRTDWRSVCPITDRTFILGNPPFIGSTFLSDEQRQDQENTWGGGKGTGTLDYVTNWYLTAARLIQGTQARVAFVSTNSITHGEQPAVLWDQGLWPLNMKIDFAHRSFPWVSEAARGAAVHVVIIGFSDKANAVVPRLWASPDEHGVAVESRPMRINPYLIDAPDVVVQNRREPLDAASQVMVYGSKPTDAGHLSTISATEAEVIRESDRIAARYLRPLLGADELINGIERWCLWLVKATPSDLRSSETLRQRVEAVQKMRSASKDKTTRADAATPSLFQKIRQPTTTYLAVPRVSSERRRYVPMALTSPETIANDSLQTIPGANLYTFGVLHGRPFQVWNATVSGRLESRFRISAEITYNNYPWPESDQDIRAAIETAAQGVLDARDAHPSSSLADLYDAVAMPPDLAKAHDQLDRAVLTAYALKPSATDAGILTALFARYEALVAPMAGMMEKKSKKR
jgi:hypothetical protein